MKVLIAGIDGYLGWALARWLVERDEIEVHGVDGLMRREWVEEVGSASAVPIAPLPERVQELERRWREDDPVLDRGSAGPGLRVRGRQRGRAGRGRPPGGVPLGAVLDDGCGPLSLRAGQQPPDDAESDVRARRQGREGPHGEARHHGRVRHTRSAHPGGQWLAHPRRRIGLHALSAPGRLVVPLEQGSRLEQPLVRGSPERIACDRCHAGDRLRRLSLGRRERGARHPFRCGRRLRHGHTSMVRASGDRHAADGVRRRRAAAGIHRTRGQRQVPSAASPQPARARRISSREPARRGASLGRACHPHRRGRLPARADGGDSAHSRTRGWRARTTRTT